MWKTTCLLLFFALAARAEDDKVILENSGFEKGMKGWTLINNSGNTESRLDKKKKKEGKQSLHLNKTGGPPFDALRADIRNLSVGNKVTVSGQFMAKDFGNGWLKVIFYDKSGNSIKQGDDVKTLKGTYSWKKIDITNEVPEGTKSAAIFILMVMSGELWMDDLKITKKVGKEKTKVKIKLKPLGRSVKSWLDRNAVKVKTLDFDGSMSDLKPIKRLIKNARIVQLGEQSHGDGESFRAKARLVRLLYQEMGFEVLAFESGLYECEMANALLEEGKVKEAMKASVFGIWRVEQTLPLFEYMAESKKPLRLTGFDTRGSGGSAKEFLIRLYDFMAPAGTISTDNKVALARIDDLLNQSPYKPGEEEREKGLAALRELRKIFDEGRNKLIEKHGERETGFYSHCLDNYMVRERFEYSKNDSDEHLSGNIRDEQMAKNLKWLCDVYYPDQKIITWAATSHQAHNLKKVSIGGDPETYKHWKNMGQYVHEWYGQKVYTIAFAAYEGEGGIFSSKFSLAKPKEGSLEDLFHRYGHPLLFVDLRKKNPFKKPLYCSPMSYNRSIKASWPEVVDAIFYIQEMTPTRFMGK